jgi:uncharacterized linocin/CFP29 family protein
MDLPPEITWNEAVKKRINDAVLEEVVRIRICQKVFPTHHFTSSPLDVMLDELDLSEKSIPEGKTRRFVELNLEFKITVVQARNEPETMICQTLSRMAAKSIALAEDRVIFQGKNAGDPLPGGVRAERLDSAKTGVLGAAEPDDADDDNPDRVSEPIDVCPLPKDSCYPLPKDWCYPLPKDDWCGPGPIYGEHVFAAVAQGIAKLVNKGQAPDYALFLPTRVYADTFAPPGNQSLVTTADRIRPLVEGGFYGTGVLPPYRGLLVALGGRPTVIYMGNEAEVEYVGRDRSRYFFSVTERVQFVARDPRALVLLRFHRRLKEVV